MAAKRLKRAVVNSLGGTPGWLGLESQVPAHELLMEGPGVVEMRIIPPVMLMSHPII
jgi:hypothetical protein